MKHHLLICLLLGVLSQTVVAQGVLPLSRTTCPASHPIKGNLSNRGEKIYHLPGGAYYKRTYPERCFKTRQEAEKAGFRASKR
ncbi:sunset domain-containing protein [Deinococcus roseus]|uniref:Ada DNA repair metal-binding domain-containing protein n=1 Tax=Deinococcus roseus TaxID=392414 RepID=A0ABQ2CVD5_9DEIO|nr:hypothetical protein [Deinococcus roseus]GGJ24670.1 hypothetical protein GCM10008938_08490 [Deinococcus roseus]